MADNRRSNAASGTGKLTILAITSDQQADQNATEQLTTSAVIRSRSDLYIFGLTGSAALGLGIVPSEARKVRIYLRDWRDITIEQFIRTVDPYVHWYSEKRIKVSLNRPGAIHTGFT